MKLISTCGTILVLISTLARAQSVGSIYDAPVTDTLTAVPLRCVWLTQYRSAVDGTAPEPGHAWCQTAPTDGAAPSMGAPHGQFYIPTPNGNKLLWGLALLTVAHAADYFVQADANNWRNPLWTNGARGGQWCQTLDWIPHDGYHVTELIRTAGMAFGTYLVYDAFADGGFPWWWNGIHALLLGMLTRGVGFSITYSMMN